MSKAELLQGLEEYRVTKQSSPGIASIVQLVIDIVAEDLEYDKKHTKEELK
jgi:hypothetical protein